MPGELIKPKEKGFGERSMGMWARNDGRMASGLIEWAASAPINFNAFIVEVEGTIPTDDDVNRPEEVRTLKVDAILDETPAAIVYQCLQRPITLSEVLLNVEKPSGDDRRALARVIATQVRSIHVHFGLVHAALRTDSFVFFPGNRNSNMPNIDRPYVLDWVRPLSSFHQHPEYEADEPLWFYDVWSLMMVLSEIAEWQPLDRVFRDEKDLLAKKLERKRTVMSPKWKGEITAKVFQHGFRFLENDRETLKVLNWQDIKRFFDELCELLGPSVAW